MLLGRAGWRRTPGFLMCEPFTSPPPLYSHLQMPLSSPPHIILAQLALDQKMAEEGLLQAPRR